MSDRPLNPAATSDRRRFLVAAGFGAANVVLLSRLGGSGTGSTSVAASGAEGTDASTSPTSIVGVNEPAALDAPPALADAGPAPGPDHVFDLLLTNGRVIDPASGYDGPLEVGINDGVITAIQPPGGKAVEILDVEGRVIAPGFIDLLSAEPNGYGEWFKVADGVTTNLCMHGVNNYANAFFSRQEGMSPVHVGGAFHQHFLRGEDLGAAPDRALDEAQIAEFAELCRTSLADGFAGICFSPEYSPGTTTAELDALTAVAAEAGHSVYFHARYSDPDEPGTSIEGLQEVIDLARRHGVGAHIEHLTSTGGTFVMDQALALMESARSDGLDLTACVYPYDYWATTLGSFRFVGDWQARYRITYENLEVAGTDRFLTESSFAAAQADNLLVAAIGSIPEADVEQALRTPWIMLGSDGILTDGNNNHPRAAGTFARTLGRYVRDKGTLGLVDALAKMTIQPAQRVETMLPQMARKGRLQRGADADITVFDPGSVIDQATVSSPASPSSGISDVFVMGQRVLASGQLDRSKVAGQVLRSS